MKILSISRVCFVGALMLGLIAAMSSALPQEMSTHQAITNVGGCCCSGASKDSSKCTGLLCLKSCYRCDINMAYTQKCIDKTKKCTSWPCSNECFPQECDRQQMC